MDHSPKINGPLTWSMLFIAVLAAIALAGLPAVVRATFARGPAETPMDDQFAALLEEHAAAAETYEDRFNGRSVFFRPRQPRPPRPPEQQKAAPTVKQTEVLAEAPEPTCPPYAGPRIVGYVGGTVWFSGDVRLGVGEDSEGLKVISVDDLPWSATIKYQDWEYDVAFLSRRPADFFAPETSSKRETMPGLVSVRAGNDDQPHDGRPRAEPVEPKKPDD